MDLMRAGVNAREAALGRDSWNKLARSVLVMLRGLLPLMKPCATPLRVWCKKMSVLFADVLKKTEKSHSYTVWDAKRYTASYRVWE